MILSLNSSVRSFGWLVVYTIVIPVAVVAAWQAMQIMLPQFPAWKLLLAVQAVTGLVLLSLYLRAVMGRSERSVWQSEFLQAQQKFEALYEHSPVPYVTIDRRGKILMCNLAAARLLGVRTDDLLERNLIEQFVADEAVDTSVFNGKIASGAPIVDAERQVTISNGSIRWVLVSVFAGQQGERLVSLVDITHQKTIDQAKSEFVALAAHQLRTPIAAIRWNVELLGTATKGSLGEDAERYIAKVVRNVTRMNTLINDFLSVSKLETGTFATDEEEIPLAEFFQSVVDEHRQTVTQKNIILDTVFEPETLVITTDLRLMHIIINNLFSNAVKYVGTGDTVSLHYQKSQKGLQITVADTGIGVPLAEQEKLFTKFYRATNAREHRTEGTGLGLYIVKQSVEMLGGTISVESEQDVGTTFTIELPL